MDNLLNVNQAAFILRVHPLTIRRYIREGKLKAVKAGGNIRIKESALSEMNQDVAPRPPRPKSGLYAKPKIMKVFTVNDPWFRLKGVGARVELSK
jgi:excisionase family DNA binding protein